MWPRLPGFAAGVRGGLAREDRRAAGELQVCGLMAGGAGGARRAAGLPARRPGPG